MADFSDLERAALRAALKPFADLMDEFGWETRLLDLTEPQALLLIEAAVGSFGAAMRALAAKNVNSEEIPF